MFCSLVLALLLVAPAAAKKPEADSDYAIPVEMLQVIEATKLGNLGERDKANKVFTEVLANDPKNIDARVGRGVNSYLLGNVSAAKADLAHAFSAATWQDVQVTSQSLAEVTTHTTTVNLVERRVVGASMLVVILARAGEVSEAAATLARARSTFDQRVLLDAAEARLLLASDKNEAAWKTLAAAVLKEDTTLFVQSVASEMVAADPSGAPEVVTGYLAQMGQWTVHLNKAIGHFRNRQYGDCVESVDAGLGSDPTNFKMLQLGYSCAARADFAKADEWLDALGGPGGADPFMVVAHAQALVDKGRAPDAVTLLAKMPRVRKDDDPTYVKSRQILHIMTLTDLGRLDEAMKLTDGTTAPEAETPLAYQLMQQHRYRDATNILERACPSLRQHPTHGNCIQLLEYASSH